MNTLQDPKPVTIPAQIDILQDFFKRDNGSEMIESLHAMIETVLFSEDLTYVTSEMRAHIVNQLRVATLIAKLERSRAA